MSAKFELDPAKFLQVVKSTIFDSRATEEELIAFLVVCNRYDLDPFRKEIYAFRQGDKIQPIVGIDGWARVVNREPQFDGCEFVNEFDGSGSLVSTTCKVYRKDRQHPIVVTEYLKECKRNTPAWSTMPARMMRHRSYIQGGRLAFGISGIMEQDEFEQMLETQARVVAPKQVPSTLADLTNQIRSEPTALRGDPVPSPVVPDATQPSAPAPSETTRANPLSDLIGEIREFEDWMLGEGRMEEWRALHETAGVTDTRNLKSLGSARLRPLVDAIRLWRRAQEGMPEPEVAPEPPPVIVPDTIPFHDQVDLLTKSMDRVLKHDLVRKHGGTPGVFNFGLSLEKQGVLLSELRARVSK